MKIKGIYRPLTQNKNSYPRASQSPIYICVAEQNFHIYLFAKT